MQTPNVLLVEDNKADMFLISEQLKNVWKDFKLTTVSYIGDAYEECKHNVFDVIILDLNLPDGHGPSSVSEMRNFYTRTPIVVLTGSYSERVRDESLKRGANEVLCKSHLMDSDFQTKLSVYGAA